MARFYHCKKAEILDDTGGKIPAAVSIAPTGGLLITVPRKYEFKPEVPAAVTFFDPILGLATCRVRLSSPLITDDHKSRCYRCEVLEQIAQDQRREDVKIPLSIEISVTLEEDAPSDDPSEWRLPPEGAATLRNISAGGAYLLSKMDLKVGDRLFFYFHGAGGTIPLTAEVLRVDARTDRHGRPINGCGCRFVDLAASYESRLRSYVFKEARRLFQDG